MKIIVGLGNPGEKYQATRHNLGLMILEQLTQELGVSELKLDKKMQAKLANKKIGKEKIIFAFPTTFMNNSGNAVQQIAQYYKIKAKDVWIIHDDFDLSLGKIRISQNSSAGGHNGIKSIIQSLSTQKFIRFRVGVGPIKGVPEKFVLKRFSKKEIKIKDQIIQQTIKVIMLGLEKGIDQAMNEYN